MPKNYKFGKYELDDHQMMLLKTDTNTLVIAGAGSGKTLTILAKINYLIENEMCSPEEILVISFTNASVNDIRLKLTHNVNVFTFHKLAMNILDANQIKYTLCTSSTLKFLINEYLRTCQIDEQKSILLFLNIKMGYIKFLNSNYYSSFCNLIETFINLFKANNYDYKNIIYNNFSNLEKKILLIILNIYKLYINEKKSVNELDFDDLIVCATKLAKKSCLKIKYIIIDEFQDTSSIRLNLIKEIFKNTSAKIIVVGDDWQSIYRFSGCDLNIFLNFTNIFPDVLSINLVNTYRNSNQLISIASNFIQKNSLQIKKKLISQKTNNCPIVFVPYKDKIKVFKSLLDFLLTKRSDIMVLSRNNKDIFEYLDHDFIFNNNKIYYKTKEIKYFTVHKSKGLEAEIVIVLNCNNDTLGFPNKIENNSLINKLIPNNEIKFAEERRLFYVAITRCKETCYLMFNKANPSIFIKEVKKITRKQKYTIKYFK